MGQTPPKKSQFFLGGSGALDEKDFGYVSGRQKNIKPTFASGKSRWLKKSEYIFTNFVGDKFRWLQLSRLVLAINRDDCSFLWLLVAINRNECIFLRLLPATNQDNCMYIFRKPYSGLQLRAYGVIRSKNNKTDITGTCKFFKLIIIKAYASRDNC